MPLLIVVIRDEATSKGIDHHLSGLAILRGGDFKIPALLRYLDVQPALGAQFLLYLGRRNRLVACDEDFALVASRRDQDPETSPENSTHQAAHHCYPVHHLSPSPFDVEETAKLNVRPARISPKGRSLMRPPRRPTSTARSSRTCQIAPIRADFVSTRPKSRS